MTTYFFKIITLLGGLALFLFGMDTMGKALERQAGGRLQTILAKMSSNVLRGFLLGAAVTAVIQSSSATTVMVVGFVNSGIMTLKQAVGVIMGSNVGTTVTAWILSLSGLEGESFLIKFFKPSTLAPLIGIIGIVLYMGRSEKRKGIGTIMLGFMALMTGMDLMSSSMSFLKNEAWFADLMISFTDPIVGILFGAVLTAVIQSSSASVGILQGLCVTGAVTYGAAIPIILGQNIGTCVTAMMGSIGANRNARRTAMVHLLFNVVGVLMFVIIFYGLGLFIDWEFLRDPVAAWDISVIHTGFNLVATAVLLPLNGLLVKLAYLFIPKEQEPQKMELLDERLLATPAVAVQRAHEIAGQMAADAAKAMHLAMGLTKRFDPAVMEQVVALEDKTDRYEDALGTYLVKLSGMNLSVHDNRILNTLLYTVSDIERLADHAMAVAKAAMEIGEKKIGFSQQAKGELAVLERAVLDVVDRTVAAYGGFDLEQAIKIEPQEQVVDALVREVKSRHVRRLRDGLCTVEYGFVLEDLLTACERAADHCSNVAVEMLQVSEGKLEAHEYLNALKAGELHESAAFAERFARYKAQYEFPEE
ncbi:MAG: Na/Pi cotransporter family protein [Oscillospiraceae bacterium]|nr:Na/Pi cotransporter family protein [Oscillospiraceae bacterium]MBQ5712828.1 Na/Pi cotransporter family protein [Oscillospiraceae bacterium]